MTGHIMRITVIGARGIRATNYFSSVSSDAYCEVSVLHSATGQCSDPQKTTVCFGTRDPTWMDQRDTVLSDSQPEGDILLFTVFGRHKLGSDTFAGQVSVPASLLIDPQILHDVRQSSIHGQQSVKGEPLERELKLLPKWPLDSKPKVFSMISGYVRVRLQYEYVQPINKRTSLDTSRAAMYASNTGIPEFGVANSRMSSTQSLPDQDRANQQQTFLYQPNSLEIGAVPSYDVMYQCPTCHQIFSSTLIGEHMGECTVRHQAQAREPFPPRNPAASSVYAHQPNNDVQQGTMIVSSC